MRPRHLAIVAVAAALALAVSACGGGDGGEGTTDLFETGSLTGFVETSELPPETATETTAEPFQIAIPETGQPVGPESPVEQVSELQKALLKLGYKIGKADGIYGEKTRKAVVKFQKAHHLKADGLVGAKTAKAINKALRELPSQP